MAVSEDGILKLPVPEDVQVELLALPPLEPLMV